MNDDPKGKVCLVTGAGGGLGRALVAAFLRDGWRVVAAAHRAAEWTPDEYLWPIVMDVTEPAQIEAAIANTIEREGSLHCLVHNAGVTADALSWQLSDESWDRALDVNLKAAFRCARAVSRTMIAQGDGQILAVSSFAGRAGARGQAAYAAAKAGLFGLVQSLAKELGPRNIRVNAILPGVLRTKMTAALLDIEIEAFARANALGRINSLDEVARFVAFLAGTQNISGQLFQLDSRIAPWS